MGAQSLVLGKQFGEGFQYGKRKISAMTNEEFNKLTPAKLAQDNAAELRQMIPSMQASITDMRSFQSFIVRELIATVKQLPSDVFSGVQQLGQTDVSSVTGLTSQDYIDAIKNLIPSIPKASAEVSQQKVIQKNVLTSGPIGPQLPTLDPFYANMTYQQLKKVFDNTSTFLRLPVTQRNLIQKRLNDEKPKTLTPQQAIITSGATGINAEIANRYAIMQTSMNAYQNSKTYAKIQIFKKQFLKRAKKYNQLVASLGKANLMIDTAKSIQFKAIIPK